MLPAGTAGAQLPNRLAQPPCLSSTTADGGRAAHPCGRLPLPDDAAAHGAPCGGDAASGCCCAAQQIDAAAVHRCSPPLTVCADLPPAATSSHPACRHLLPPRLPCPPAARPGLGHGAPGRHRVHRRRQARGRAARAASAEQGQGTALSRSAGLLCGGCACPPALDRPPSATCDSPRLPAPAPHGPSASLATAAYFVIAACSYGLFGRSVRADVRRCCRR